MVCIFQSLRLNSMCFLFFFLFTEYCFLSDVLSSGEKENKHILSWATRYKVALGVAEALDYLHGGSGTEPVIHRDVKSSNILLSEDFEPQV